MNLAKKSAPWVVGSLLAAASAFAQNSKNMPAKNMNQGEPLMPNQYMAAYNAPARIDVKGAWDFYGILTFTYWQAVQENMEPALQHDETNPDGVTFVNNYINMDFGYKPGFKVGGGMNFDYDGWDSSAMYTWFRGKNHQNTELDSANTAITLTPLVGASDDNANAFYVGDEKWTLHMDLVDWDLGRTYYNGTALTFRPAFGVRGAWIRQYLAAVFTGDLAGDPTAQTSHMKSNSWAVGPRVSVNANWLLGEGFRLFGNGGGDILYTRYTSIVQKNYDYSGAPSTDTVNDLYSQSGLGVLKPHLDLELGLGWGSYFDNNNWHVDLSAGYAFQVFFDQNMFRNPNAASDTTNGASADMPNGNLYMHGMNLNVKFDF